MVLHDIECNVCGYIRFDELIDVAGEKLNLRCHMCKKYTEHSILFNQFNSPLRGVDLLNRLRRNPRDVAKRITHEKPEAHDCDGNPIVDKNGNVLHERLTDDKYAERKEKRLYEKERKLGLRPIYTNT